MQQLWLVTLPNRKESADSTFQSLQSSFGGQNCGIHKFVIPPLQAGTLDSLMALSDDLGKINSQIENVAKKVERQYMDVKGSSTEPLMLGGTMTVETFLRKFTWDLSRYPHQGRQLGELVSQIQISASTVDEELKKLTTLHAEKAMNLSTLQRKKVINISTSDFEDFMKPDVVARVDILNTESLLTVVVIVPKALEKEFVKVYNTIGSEIAGFGGPDWSNSSAVGSCDGKFGSGIDRMAVLGSPVVPDSHVRVLEEGDQVMYTVTVLKGHYKAGGCTDGIFLHGSFVDYLEPLKAAFREKRFVMREFSYDQSKAGGLDGLIAKADDELRQLHASTLRWCQAHFGEVYSGCVHLKVIRAYVESVLRYGLPLDLTSVFLEPNLRREKQLSVAVTKTIVQLCPELALKAAPVDEEDEESESTENLPYVCQKFAVIGTA